MFQTTNQKININLKNRKEKPVASSGTNPSLHDAPWCWNIYQKKTDQLGFLWLHHGALPRWISPGAPQNVSNKKHFRLTPNPSC